MLTVRLRADAVLIACSYSPTGIIAAYSLIRSSSQMLINKKKILAEGGDFQHSLVGHVIRVTDLSTPDQKNVLRSTHMADSILLSLP